MSSGIEAGICVLCSGKDSAVYKGVELYRNAARSYNRKNNNRCYKGLGHTILKILLHAIIRDN